MRMNRLVLALAPILLGACSDDSSATGDTDGGTPSAGPTSGGTVTGTTGAVATGMGMGPSTTATNTSGGPSTTGGSAVTTTGNATTGGPTTGSGTTGGATVDGVGGGSGTSDTTGSGTTGGTTGPMTCPYTPPEDPATFPDGWSAHELITFNDNGGWTWYNDERVVVDAEGGNLVVSSARSSAGSQTADTNIDAVIYNLASGEKEKMALGSLSYSDDHNNGGIVVKNPGEYFVAFAHHNVDCNTYWRNYGASGWSDKVTYTWGQGCPWGTRPDEITYNNPWKMSSENNRLYNFIRSVNTSPNFLVSEDNGENWTYGGRLTASPQQGYNAGYYKYWGNGVDRIDFFATEAHPRDANTSVWHGYVKGGKSYNSTDQEIDGDIFDGEAPEITEFTNVFRAGGQLNGVTLHRLWNFDIARYEDGTIGVLWQGRENECLNQDKNSCNPGHHLAYSRFNGTEWSSTYLVPGGRTLYRNRSDWWEEDYLGGGALDPDDPHVIYVSTPIDPRDGTTDHTMHEIWKGVSCDDGATFQWTPMTMNSANENLRPVVPKWDAENTAVLWFQGNYQTAQMYSAQVKGFITQR